MFYQVAFGGHADQNDIVASADFLTLRSLLTGWMNSPPEKGNFLLNG
jgi:hypothetical protein